MGVRSGRLEVTVKEKLASWRLLDVSAGGVRAGADQYSGAGGVFRAGDSGAVAEQRWAAAGICPGPTV